MVDGREAAIAAVRAAQERVAAAEAQLEPARKERALAMQRAADLGVSVPELCDLTDRRRPAVVADLARRYVE